MLIYKYLFWLAAVSLLCMVLERIFPWRKKQPFVRPQLVQDWFWLLFNGAFAGMLLGPLFSAGESGLRQLFQAVLSRNPQQLRLFSGLSLPLQIVVFLFISDLLEWIIHYGLHRIPLLWRFHRVHHSIRIMDWIGNFRFHWMEIIVYHLFKYLPLALLGVRWEVLLITGVFATLIGHLNHSNLHISWGPLRYLFNSPAMHIWHHDVRCHFRYGQNFAVVFSIWDWLFGTAWMPEGQPERLGFHGGDVLPDSLLWRFFLPFLDHKGDQ